MFNTTITAIIFDLGGVILNLDVGKTERGLRKIMGIEAGNDNNHSGLISVLKDYETGKLNSGQFIDSIYSQAVIKTSREEIIDVWNAMLVDIPQKRIKLLKKLAKNYRLFLLSNTNELHVNYFENMVKGKQKFRDLFEKVYYSHIIKCRKPDKRAFQIVIAENNLDVSTTLFIDDNEDNIETAKATGFQTVHITADLDLTDVFTV